MAIYRAQTTISMDTGIPADAVTNTMHFDLDIVNSAPSDIITNAQAALETFYAEAYGLYYSPAVNPVGLTTEWYNLADTPPRVPASTRTWDLGTTNNNSLALPPEVALVASFQGPKLSGVNQARRRNRIFLGPLNGATLAAGTGQAGVASQIVTAMENLSAASTSSVGDDSWTWVWYSPTDSQGGNVTNGWCDNAFDTQRRRGLIATSRSTWSN